MKNTIAATLLVLVSIQANAYERITPFTVENLAVDCQVGSSSRSAGMRSVSIVSETKDILSAAVTSEGVGLRTNITARPAAFNYSSKSCRDLGPIPSVLKGTHQLSIQKLEWQGQCSTIVIEQVSIELGAGNPVVTAKTAWPVVGNDLSEYNKTNCNLTNEDYERAFNRM